MRTVSSAARSDGRERRDQAARAVSELEFRPGSEVRPWIEDGQLCGSVETTDDEVTLKILIDWPRRRKDEERRP